MLLTKEILVITQRILAFTVPSNTTISNTVDPSFFDDDDDDE